MALVLTRKEGQSMLISDGKQEIKIKIAKIESGRQVRIVIEAPEEMRISRISEVPNGNAQSKT